MAPKKFTKAHSSVPVSTQALSASVIAEKPVKSIMDVAESAIATAVDSASIASITHGHHTHGHHTHGHHTHGHHTHGHHTHGNHTHGNHTHGNHTHGSHTHGHHTHHALNATHTHRTHGHHAPHAPHARPHAPHAPHAHHTHHTAHVPRAADIKTVTETVHLTTVSKAAPELVPVTTTNIPASLPSTGTSNHFVVTRSIPSSEGSHNHVPLAFPCVVIAVTIMLWCFGKWLKRRQLSQIHANNEKRLASNERRRAFFEQQQRASYEQQQEYYQQRPEQTIGMTELYWPQAARLPEERPLVAKTPVPPFSNGSSWSSGGSV